MTMLKTKVKNNPYIIYVDKREPEEIYEEILYLTTAVEKFLPTQDFNGFSVKYKQIPVGDLVCGYLCVERKEIKDFVGSIHDGRIFAQFKRMAKNYRYGFVLVSGDIDSIAFSSMKGVYSTLADVEIRYNIRTMFFPNDELLCYYFVTLCKKLTKRLVPTLEMFRDAPKDEDIRMRMIRSVPFFGKILAKAVINKYLSIHEICHAEPKDIAKIEGIGKIKAQKLHDILNKKGTVVERKKS